jgi:hypothetical protein
MADTLSITKTQHVDIHTRIPGKCILTNCDVNTDNASLKNKHIEIFNFQDKVSSENELSDNELAAFNEKNGKKKNIWKTVGLIALGVGVTALGIYLLRKNGLAENDEPFLTDLKQYIKNYPQRIKYTCKHKKAFLQVEKELCGKNSINGYLHDSDRLLMYIAGLPQELVNKIHNFTAPHHIRNGKVKNPVMAVIDWECAHLTKPDKPLRAREYYEKCCTKMPEIETALKKLGL